MSRRRVDFTAIAVTIFVITSLSPTMAQSQNRPPLTAEDVSASADAAYGPPPPEPKCAPQEGDEIVVCAEEEDQDQFRVKSSSELDPTSEEAIADGLPRAPDVGGPGIFTGKATVSGLCFIPPCPEDPAYIIDFSELPETPPGSDADRVGKGLAPLGEANGAAVSSTVDQIEVRPSSEPETD